MSGWRARLKGLAALAVLVAWPLFLVWAWGGGPSFPTAAELRQFFTDINDYAAGQLLLRALVLAAWTLWAYLVAVLLPWMVAARALERRGHPMLANELEAQPRWARALVGSLLLLVLATSQRSAAASGPGPVAAAATIASGAAARPAPQGPTTAERVVRSGDTLTSIARELLGGVSKDDPRIPQLVDEIFELTRGHEVAPRTYLRNKNFIMPEWRIRVPVLAATAGATGTRLVRRGDTLTSIARELLGAASNDPRVRRLVDEIVELNRGHEVAPGTYLRDKNEIVTGWRILVPPAPDSAAAAALAPSSPARTVTSEAREAQPAPAPSAPTVGPGHPSDTTVAPASPAAPRPDAQSTTHGTVAPGARSQAPPVRAAAEGEDRAEEPGVRIPGGPLVPVALGCAVLASLVRARRERLRTWKPGQPIPTEEPEGPLAEATRAAGVVPTFDLVGPFAEGVLEAWHQATGEAARVQGAWERPESVSFLLTATGSPRRAEVTDDTTGIRVRFHSNGDGTVRAVASGPRLPSLRRSLVAIADGLLVPVGHRSEGALHLPLLGSPVSVSGPDADRLVETALVTAGLRARTEEVRIVVVGDVPPLLTDLALGEVELPDVERVDRPGEPALRDELEAEIVRRARRISDRGGEDLHDYALLRADDRLGVVILVLDERVASAWASLLEQGTGFGVASIVVGSPAGTVRRLMLEDGGLTVEAPTMGRVTGLVPYLLPRRPAESAAHTERPPALGDLDPESLPASPPVPMPTASSAGGSVPTPSARTRSGARHHVPEEPFVSVLLLGDRIRVVRQGRDSEAEPDREKARELVAYLAGCPDGATAEQLCDVLWPERAMEDGRPGNRRDLKSSLSACVSNARRWLEAGAINPPEPLPLMGGRYRLAFEHVWVDVAAFEDAVGEARTAGEPGTALRRALELYRGDLCQGLDRAARTKRSAEQFLWVERDGIRWDLRKDAVWAAHRLASVLLERGEPAAALDVLQPLLTNGPVSEALECRAMECHAALRDREALYRRWVRLQSRLAEEFDVEPLPETAELYRSLVGSPSAARTA